MADLVDALKILPSSSSAGDDAAVAAGANGDASADLAAVKDSSMNSAPDASPPSAAQHGGSTFEIWRQSHQSVRDQVL